MWKKLFEISFGVASHNQLIFITGSSVISYGWTHTRRHRSGKVVFQFQVSSLRADQKKSIRELFVPQTGSNHKFTKRNKSVCYLLYRCLAESPKP